MNMFETFCKSSITWIWVQKRCIFRLKSKTNKNLKYYLTLNKAISLVKKREAFLKDVKRTGLRNTRENEKVKWDGRNIVKSEAVSVLLFMVLWCRGLLTLNVSLWILTKGCFFRVLFVFLCWAIFMVKGFVYLTNVYQLLWFCICSVCLNLSILPLVLVNCLY